MTHVRPAQAEDALAVAAVHVRSWQWAYRGLIAQDYLDSLTPAAWASRYTFGRVGVRLPSTVVAVDGSVICGLATTGLSDELPNHGELMALYVDPDYLGRGVGRALMGAARQRMRALGVAGASLWVLAGNDRARWFYERDGWAFDGTRRLGSYGGAPVEELRYRCTPV
ncbi:N-acetyltransferase [Mycobacterium kubicae]|uniref:N-acetyltransferase n=1 Tax=Mycobacterium kubicae TaxID=120959 RepID=A0AAX1JFU0_9MYCO|nr:GNAT family N-acetyltransferase [Mycobacterium kubicae]MCV7095956.1 GNAT family N-acetyltransferase [Mycobacterium kubicae]ORV99352.1 acetyltransferase [Mycobacterium kubicae]QNI12125.1 GNAT family N-acetyltransferase [Mycobacterium kubicae]QPI40354.1 GNAT family N-acetyltransferase [Mycobacterium kubicae]GFG65099.1 N-acetyltransferase [Mycobacterium kubicae]